VFENFLTSNLFLTIVLDVWELTFVMFDGLFEFLTCFILGSSNFLIFNLFLMIVLGVWELAFVVFDGLFIWVLNPFYFGEL
jgi:hypothetical protein